MESPGSFWDSNGVGCYRGVTSKRLPGILVLRCCVNRHATSVPKRVKTSVSRTSCDSSSIEEQEPFPERQALPRRRGVVANIPSRGTPVPSCSPDVGPWEPEHGETHRRSERLTSALGGGPPHFEPHGHIGPEAAQRFAVGGGRWPGVVYWGGRCIPTNHVQWDVNYLTPPPSCVGT